MHAASIVKSDFQYCHRISIEQIIVTGCNAKHHENSFKTFCGRYGELIANMTVMLPDFISQG